ncbi:unnamed protein product [Nyctereutes procyonoides]|uniref:(raccoon dog) hypothetical protein n=1 Tax=Nyctereutes procyonoides TaxID=34880 RepID=A0A811ZNV5_NYCPR|nr:unnamed protein product [Nyctereutes procyonoides]
MGQAMGPEKGNGPLSPLGQNRSQGLEQTPPTPRASKHSTATGLPPDRHYPFWGAGSPKASGLNMHGKELLQLWEMVPQQPRPARSTERHGSTPEPGPLAGPNRCPLPPSAAPRGDEGARAIKDNRHAATCPGPAAAAGHTEVTACKGNQFPGLVGRNNSISEEQELCLGLQSPSQ